MAEGTGPWLGGASMVSQRDSRACCLPRKTIEGLYTGVPECHRRDASGGWGGTKGRGRAPRARHLGYQAEHGSNT